MTLITFLGACREVGRSAVLIESNNGDKILLDYGNLLKGELDRQNIQVLFFLGDIFHNREEIGVNTLSICEQFFNIFTNPLHPVNVVLLTGNHDSYLRDSAKINSISILKGWPNITIIDQITSIDIKNKKLTFIPWGEDIEKCEKSDILFGHFEINTFKMNVQKVCEHGINSDVLLKKSPLIFTGHFHTKDERTYPNGKIIYTGCPFAQNWGDLGLTKGYYILNAEQMTYEFFENTISPKYFKINYMDLFDKGKIEEIKKNIPNNFIKLQVDDLRAFVKKIQKEFRDIYFARKIWRNAGNKFFDKLIQAFNGKIDRKDEKINKIMELFYKNSS